MTDIIDRIYFQELGEQNPREVCNRTGCRYDEEGKSFTVSAWGEEYVICPRERKIVCPGKKIHPPQDLFYLFVIYYLLKSKDITARNEWISEKDLPGGATFFRGPHEIPTGLITGRYGNDIEAFEKGCGQLQGSALDMADAAYRFTITPNIPVLVLYWCGDDEFPPEAKILYDRTISDHLTSDIVFALAVGICTRIGKVRIPGLS